MLFERNQRIIEAQPKNEKKVAKVEDNKFVFKQDCLSCLTVRVLKVWPVHGRPFEEIDKSERKRPIANVKPRK